ncbi:MAG: glycosyltransferase family 10 [Rhodobacteraceae bacterium]|nr:glycosyltransferase family 10 [Paracoccaceae bacterium]
MKQQTNTDPAICVLPYDIKIKFALGWIPLNKLIWPIAPPFYQLHTKGKLIRDLTEDVHLICFADKIIRNKRNPILKAIRTNIRANLSLIVAEPDAYDAIHLNCVRNLLCDSTKYFRVLTFNTKLLNSLPNAVFFNFAYCSINPQKRTQIAKTKNVSLIASEKNYLEGHKLRHLVASVIIENGLDIDLMGRKYKFLDDTSEGLLEYRYSVVIENSIQESYFTEKLIDALVCETIPIYWGAPNIGDYFDKQGIIQCYSIGEIVSKLKSLSISDYEERKEAIINNKHLASRNYADKTPHFRAAKLLYSEIIKE